LIGVAGWEALANPVRVYMTAPAVIARIGALRRVSIIASL
jgi:hypothetical protein